MIEGHATPAGTAAYSEAHPAPAGHYRIAQGLTLSSLGMGSYLGGTAQEARREYGAATHACLRGGVNVLDTAANYRDQASERDLGRGLARFVADGGDRCGVLVCSKAGFLHGDCDERDQDTWFEEEYGGVLAPTQVLSGHSLAPAYIAHELERSRRNLGLATLDVLMLHNPEHQLEWGVSEPTFLARVGAAFEVLERACDAGQLRMYGVATWDGLRTPPDQKGHLSLVKLVHEAGQARMRAGGRAGDHHLRVVQLPVNLAMTEAALRPTQPFRFGAQTPLECAKELGMVVLASASLAQMRLGSLPPDYAKAFGTTSAPDTALQFTRSVPGVTTALVGMGRQAHAAANTSFVARRAPDPAVAKTLLGTGSVHGW